VGLEPSALEEWVSLEAVPLDGGGEIYFGCGFFVGFGLWVCFCVRGN